MKIGIGILSYNRPQALEQCLKSLFSNLSDSADVAVNFDRWDNTFEALAKQFPIWALRGEPRGVPFANNRLLQFFAGYDAIFLVQDDVCFLRPDWLELYIRALGAVPYLSFFDPYYHEEPKRERHFKVNFYNRRRRVTRNGVPLVLCHKSPMGAFQALTRECLERVGYFDPELKTFGGEHCDYWLRTCNAGFSPHEHFYDLAQSAELLKIDWNQTPSLTVEERDAAYAQTASWREHLYQSGGEGRIRVWVPAGDCAFEVLQPGPPKRIVDRLPSTPADWLNRRFWVYAHRLPILAYHAVDNAPGDRYAVSPEQFRKQIRALSQEFRWFTAGKIAEHWLQRQCIPENAAMLTFDDGYQDILGVVPFLADAGIRATIYVPTNWIGQENTWDRGAYRNRRHLDWQELRELIRLGHEIGSHGMNHDRLTRLPIERAVQELELSRSVLEDELGVPVRTLAYPFGGTDTQLSQMSTRIYDAAFVAGTGGIFDWNENRMALRRITVEPADDESSLCRKIADYMCEAPSSAPVWTG